MQEFDAKLLLVERIKVITMVRVEFVLGTADSV